jgi:cation diffusion facilitator family transporter
LRAAYLHVLADAMTSVLAIVALVAGKALGWIWMDAVMGIVGAVVITRWSYGLLRDTSKILLDSSVDRETVSAMLAAIESDADNRVSDLHVWRVGSHHLAAVLSVVTHSPKCPEYYKELLAEFNVVHVTVEVNPCVGDPCLAV